MFLNDAWDTIFSVKCDIMKKCIYLKWKWNENVSILEMKNLRLSKMYKLNEGW